VYWRVLKKRLIDEGSNETVTKCNGLKTNIIHEEWSGLSVKNHKNIKGLKQENLRDHMSEAELIFTALAELSTREIAESVEAKGFAPNEVVVHKGGKISGDARKNLEKLTGKKVVNNENFLSAEKKKELK
jgi:DNA-damage-inducible protein D